VARRVDVVRVKAGASRGTGFLVDSTRVLTALHVLGSTVNGKFELLAPTIELTFASMREDAPESLRFPVYVCGREDVLDFDDHLDWACIGVDEEAVTGILPLPMRSFDQDDQNAQWDTYGFPNDFPDDGKATTGIVASTGASMRVRSVSVAALQVFSREAASARGGIVHGYSGGPVIVEHHVIGMLTAAAEDNGTSLEGTLYAIPLSSIVARLGLSLGAPRKRSRSDELHDTPAPDWEKRIDAIERRFLDANKQRESKPLLAAVQAIQVVERIVDYLIARNMLGSSVDDSLEVRLKRLHAKGVIPTREEMLLSTAYTHMRSFTQPATRPREPEPRELLAGFSSLELVVEWFFRDTLKRPPPALEPQLERRAGSAGTDATPMSINSLVGTVTAATGIGTILPVWRGSPSPSKIRLDFEQGGRLEQKLFSIDDVRHTYLLGRNPRSDGTTNDFAIPKGWYSVSHEAAAVTVAEGDVAIRNTSRHPNVLVGGEVISPGTSRVLRHRDTVQLGTVVGEFSDGRYYSGAPASAIDPRTGLLSRQGLRIEIANALAASKPHTLLVLRCSNDIPVVEDNQTSADPERRAVEASMAVHRFAPLVPVARIGSDVGVLVSSDARLDSFADAATSALGIDVLGGFVAMTGAPEEAGPRLEASLGALGRIAIAGRDPRGLVNLTQYALTPTPLEAFPGQARALFGLGGGAVLFALGEVDRLKRLSPRALPMLELEMMEIIGARMGPRDVVSFAGPGLVAFATPGDVDRFAQDASVTWHSRGPISSDSVEIHRGLAAHLIAERDLQDLPKRAAALARGAVGALDLAGYPAPFTTAALQIDDAPSAVERTRRMIDLAETAWKFVAFALLAAARDAGPANARPSPRAPTGRGPEVWLSLAREGADALGNTASRVSELAAIARATDGDGPLRSALTTIGLVSASAPSYAGATVDTIARVERAVRELLTAMSVLRAWTLVAVEDVQFEDPTAASQRVEYVDYTGQSAAGSHQTVSAIGFRGLGRFVYLTRWTEGMAIALEPYVRRVRNAATGGDELFVAVAPILAPGRHRYRTINGSHEVDLEVTQKQLGRDRR
jgi:hypothetical protein